MEVDYVCYRMGEYVHKQLEEGKYIYVAYW